MIHDLAIKCDGPSRMMAAINAVNYFNSNKNNENNNHHNNFNVIIFEKNNQFGKKLLLTGGGWCNIANTIPIKEQVVKFDSTGNITKKFIKNILFLFTNNDILNFFENKRVNFKIEDNNRHITENGNSKDILDVLESTINDLDIKIIFNFDVDNITNNENYIITSAENIKINAKSIIIATGASSYPKTGSVGKGYELARTFNHNINKVIPGLIPLKIDSNYSNKYFKDLYGLTFESVTVSFNEIDNNNKNTKNNTTDIKVEERGKCLN